MKAIKLHGKLGEGKVALIDNEDYEYLSQFRWYLAKTGYAFRTKKVAGKTQLYLMHRELLPKHKLPHTDHINRDKLDNRKSNLKPCSVSENAANQKLRSDNTTGHKGIYWMKDKKLWKATTKKNGKLIYIGKFKLLVDAVTEHRKRFLEIHGIEP